MEPLCARCPERWYHGIIFRDAQYGLTSISSAGSGLLKKLLMKAGQEIHVGDPVAILDYSVQRKLIWLPNVWRALINTPF